MKLLLLLSSISCHILLLLLPPVSSSHCHLPATVSLGDSNSDTGGLSATFGPVPSPYGETFFRMPAGRFSDGRLIIDFMAERLGLPYLSAYLDSLGANFNHGANFATAASTIIPQNTTLNQGGYSPFSLDVQLQQFLQFKNRSQVVAHKGKVFEALLPRRGYFSRALYTFDIGQNDLTAGYFSNKSADQFIPEALNEFSAAVKNIYEHGGRYFWILNTGPLGCLPYVLLRGPLTASQLDSTGCGIPYNELAQQFNRMLNLTVVQLRKELPRAAFTYVDIYSAKYTLIKEAKKHGFEKPLAACCGYGGGKYNFDFSVRCGYPVVSGDQVLTAKSCKDPSKRINWDGIHYTEAANRWVFDHISMGAFSDPPVPLSMACRKQCMNVGGSSCIS